MPSSRHRHSPILTRRHYFLHHFRILTQTHQHLALPENLATNPFRNHPCFRIPHFQTCHSCSSRRTHFGISIQNRFFLTGFRGGVQGILSGSVFIFRSRRLPQRPHSLMRLTNRTCRSLSLRMSQHPHSLMHSTNSFRNRSFRPISR